MWVLYSERPLQAEALSCLGSGVGSADLDPENVSALPSLVIPCRGLVTAEASSSTHPTFQEHPRTPSYRPLEMGTTV